MSFVQFWPIGSSNDTTLSLTQADISRFLLADWLPTLPVSLSRSVMGWPRYLIEAESGSSTPYLFLRQIAGWSERQWKGVLSWMLGVAGTRRVLDREQYTYIAPCSAFYPSRTQVVSTPSWHPHYPPSILEITQNPSNSSLFRPDYIAARNRPAGRVEFSFVESKGSARSLRSLTSCPQNWSNQVRNAIVKVNGVPITIPRHIVVATRCNPNAVRQKTRRLQIRAWNSNNEEPSLNDRAFIEIVSAHYAALLRNLGLINNLKAMEIAALGRLRQASKVQQQLKEAIEIADMELEQMVGWTESGTEGANISIQTDFGIVRVQIAKQAISLIHALRSEILIPKLNALTSEYLIAINRWYLDEIREHQDNEHISIDRSGFFVKLET